MQKYKKEHAQEITQYNQFLCPNRTVYKKV